MKSVDDAEIDARVMLMVPAPEAGEFALGVEFDVTLPSIPDPELAIELVRTAHELCPYSKATRGNVDIRLTVNGLPVD
jgi:lipoyl-dependent peroxiredoxin